MGRSKRRGREAAVAPGDLPPAFRERMVALLGPEAGAFLESLAQEDSGLRVNTLRAPVAAALDLLEGLVTPLAFPAEGFLVASGWRPGKHPLHAAGLYYLQDPAAMVVGALLDPRPGERVADLSAAPGGKATHIAALMRNRGFLLANDVSPGRARELAGNLERLGVTNAMVTIESLDRLADRLGAAFDRVLLDAPCSGEAMFCRSEAARRGWSPAAVDGCARRQEELLAEAGRLVRPGGRLVYSTCTFSPEEDEQVVAAFLRALPDFELVSPPPIPGAEPGRPEWSGAEPLPQLERTIRLWPHRTPGAGHFVAILRRAESAPAELAATSAWEGGGADEAPAAEAALFRGFRDATLLDTEIGSGTILRRGEELFAAVDGAPDPGELRTLRPGLPLGTAARGHFLPAHGLAMALRPEQLRDTVELAGDERRTRAFLRGETLSAPGPPGWVLVTCSGLPLGWGKRVGSTLKNHLPKGLRAP